MFVRAYVSACGCIACVWKERKRDRDSEGKGLDRVACLGEFFQELNALLRPETMQERRLTARDHRSSLYLGRSTEHGISYLDLWTR